jgi:hypothetical protein
VSAWAATAPLASNTTAKIMLFMVHPPILSAPIPVGRAAAVHKFDRFRLQIGQDGAIADGI